MLPCHSAFEGNEAASQ